MSSSDDKRIILYDFPGKVPGGSYSPSPWKARLALNMKGIPYRTVWVDHPDITSHCISIGAAPTSYIIDPATGTKTPRYTFPVIHDPATGVTISDSMKIARYLDTTYPDAQHPKIAAVLGTEKLGPLVPEGTEVLLTVFEAVWTEKIGMNLFPLLLVDLYNRGATARARENFRSAREKMFGKKLEEVIPNEEVKAEKWKKALGGLTQVSAWLDFDVDGNGPKRFVMGDRVSWADLLVGMWLLMLRRIWGEENKEWKELMTVNEGRWKRYFEVFVTWDYVDEEAVATLDKWLD